MMMRRDLAKRDALAKPRTNGTAVSNTARGVHV